MNVYDIFGSGRKPAVTESKIEVVHEYVNEDFSGLMFGANNEDIAGPGGSDNNDSTSPIHGFGEDYDNIPDLENVGEQVVSIMDAERRLAQGDRIFAFHEMDEEPAEIHDVGQLAGYDAEQLLAVPQGVAEGSLEEIDRRGFLRGLGAAAVAGAAGGAIAGQEPIKQLQQRCNQIFDSVRKTSSDLMATRLQNSSDRQKAAQWIDGFNNIISSFNVVVKPDMIVFGKGPAYVAQDSGYRVITLDSEVWDQAPAEALTWAIAHEYGHCLDQNVFHATAKNPSQREQWADNIANTICKAMGITKSNALSVAYRNMRNTYDKENDPAYSRNTLQRMSDPGNHPTVYQRIQQAKRQGIELSKAQQQGPAQGVAEGFSNDMSTADMIAYLRQHHDTNLHQDYLDHINTFSKFVLRNIPVNSIKTDLPALDRAKVEQYKQMDFSKAPPIVIGGGYILDGYHRANVAKALGIPTIKAYVGVQGKPGVAEAPHDDEVDYDDKYQAMVKRVGQKAREQQRHEPVDLVKLAQRLRQADKTTDTTDEDVMESRLSAMKRAGYDIL